MLPFIVWWVVTIPSWLPSFFEDVISPNNYQDDSIDIMNCELAKRLIDFKSETLLFDEFHYKNEIWSDLMWAVRLHDFWFFPNKIVPRNYFSMISAEKNFGKSYQELVRLGEPYEIASFMKWSEDFTREEFVSELINNNCK